MQEWYQTGGKCPCGEEDEACTSEEYLKNVKTHGPKLEKIFLEMFDSIDESEEYLKNIQIQNPALKEVFEKICKNALSNHQKNIQPQR